MIERHVILGVHVLNRLTRAADVQRILTENGCHIKTRIGLHDVQGALCAPGGLLLLELVGTPDDGAALMTQLGAIDGLQVQRMVFEH